MSAPWKENPIYDWSLIGIRNRPHEILIAIKSALFSVAKKNQVCYFFDWAKAKRKQTGVSKFEVMLPSGPCGLIYFKPEWM